MDTSFPDLGSMIPSEEGLALLRKSKGLSPARVAADFGVSETTVRRWETSGLRKLPIVKKLAEYYDTPLEEFIALLPSHS